VIGARLIDVVQCAIPGDMPLYERWRFLPSDTATSPPFFKVASHVMLRYNICRGMANVWRLDGLEPKDALNIAATIPDIR
jgi:hypothetical protein